MKSGRWEVEEKSSGIADKKIGSAGLVRAAPPLILPPLGRSRSEFPEHCR